MARRPKPDEMLTTLRGSGQFSVAPKKAAHNCMGASKPTRKAMARLWGSAWLKGAMAGMTPESLSALHRIFVKEHIEPILLDRAFDLIQEHRIKGDTIVIITATNTLVTRPIADRLGVEHLIGCEAEIENGYFTGKPSGIPSFAEGKVIRIKSWCEAQDQSMEGAVFYSDSHNDLPLLQAVDKPVAVDPDERLKSEALRNGWDIISLRD